jgi:hypothetical protein
VTRPCTRPNGNGAAIAPLANPTVQPDARCLVCGDLLTTTRRSGKPKKRCRGCAEFAYFLDAAVRQLSGADERRRAAARRELVRAANRVFSEWARRPDGRFAPAREARP